MYNMAANIYPRFLHLLWVLFFHNRSTFVFFIVLYNISVFVSFIIFSVYLEPMVFLGADLHIFSIAFSTDQLAAPEAEGGVSVNPETYVSQGKGNFISLEKQESSFDETGSLKEGANFKDMQKIAEKYNAATASAQAITEEAADALPESTRPIGKPLIKSNSFRSSLAEALVTHTDPSQAISPSHKPQS